MGLGFLVQGLRVLGPYVLASGSGVLGRGSCWEVGGDDVLPNCN